MKGDQIVRSVAAAGVVAAYGIYVGLNGNGPVAVSLLGEMHPFVMTVFALMTLAFPELLDRFPMGPTRAKDSGKN